METSYRSKHTAQCATCGKEFAMNYLQLTRRKSDATAAVYCSRVCSGTSRAPDIACTQCGKQFSGNDDQRRALRNDPKARVFCSRRCYGDSKVL